VQEDAKAASARPENEDAHSQHKLTKVGRKGTSCQPPRIVPLPMKRDISNGIIAHGSGLLSVMSDHWECDE
jgi:hypothetical protein